MVKVCSLDDVGQGYDLAQLEEGRIAYTLGRQPARPRRWVNASDALREAGVDKIVFSSTCATYGIPTGGPFGS
jgi:hypothetical protein